MALSVHRLGSLRLLVSLCIVSQIIEASERGHMSSRKRLESTPKSNDNVNSLVLDDLVDLILAQNREVLAGEGPRVTRQASGDRESSWTSEVPIQEPPVTEALDLDDKHIQYDVIPGHRSLPESKLKLSQDSTTLPQSATEAQLDAANSTIVNTDTDSANKRSIDQVSSTEATGRNSLARSINQQNEPLLNKAQQHTRPPYATNDQFQLSSPTGNNEHQKLTQPGQLVELSHVSTPPNGVSPDMGLYFSKDQLFSAAGSISPSRAHNDRYTDEFQRIMNSDSPPPQQMASQTPEQPDGRSANPQLFAASFVNITAPFAKQLSATEAMKAEIANSKKGFLQQTNSFAQSSSLESTRTTNQAPISHYYIGPQYDQQIYSAPVNQFPMNSQDEPVPQASSSVNLQDKERMRLEPQSGSFSSSSLTGRRPYGGLNMTSHIHQASGFRSPFWTTTTSDGFTTNSAMLNAATATISASIMNASYPQIRSPIPAQASPTIAPTVSNPTSVNTTITNGFITSSSQSQQPVDTNESMQPNPNRRLYNLTRVEHISAECSNDLIRTVIVFNGTFKGIIYSSGYVRDPNCMYINGTGKTRYDFSIRLNQCGTLSRQEVHTPSGPSDISRQDKIMWNTLSIQYNPIIEQEWDEHFRVSCEYGSDFWKTVSFNPFNVETNTGSPVVFTVDPPQCQMEVLRGYGVMGPRQEAVSGPVTVGDPLTLLIHMKSEKAGYDILVKNCIAHNGGTQKMQLIDSNGCVVNERFISPFRGNYNDNELRHVTLYSFLKAFRFTGSPVLYLECEIHMCQSKCPPQMCYWRRLSKRSVGTNDTIHMPEDESSEIVGKPRRRTGRKLKADGSGKPDQLFDKVSLFQALEVRHDVPSRGPDAAAYKSESDHQSNVAEESFVCYRRVHFFAFLLGAGSVILVAISVATCCWRAASARIARDILERQVSWAGLAVGGPRGPLNAGPMDQHCQGLQRRANLLNASYHKALSSMNPIRHHMAVTSHKERLLTALQ